MTYKEVVKVLERNGWKCIRSNGSHFLYQKDGNGPTIPVPNHSGKDLPIGTLKSIEKGTGLSF